MTVKQLIDALQAVKGQPPTKKIGPNVFVLFAAAAIKSGAGCIYCGCTDDRACPGGCSWTHGDEKICSRCAGG